ncbi:MAG: sulfatase [Promethearchaeota archaeon]
MEKKVIFITIDCLRKDHLKIYQYNKDSAPNIEKIAKEAIIFENAIANGSNTPSSFYSIFSSTVPTAEGSYAPIPFNKRKLAEVLQKNKIKTCGIHSNPHLTSFCNYHLGFDYFIDIFENPQFSMRKRLIDNVKYIFNRLGLKDYLDRIKAIIFKFLPLNNKISSFKTEKINAPYSNAKVIVSEAIKWLHNNYNKSFFLWIHFMDVHRPYYPPLKFIEEISNEPISESLKVYLNDLFDNYKKIPNFMEKINDSHIKALNILYDAEIRYVDHYLGILFTYLRRLRIFDSTFIILTSDHGQALFDHNQLSHGVTLYDELLKIPFIIKGDQTFNKKIRIFDQIELLDFAPTVLDVFKLPKDNSFHGKSLVDLIMGNESFKQYQYVISAIYFSKDKMFTAYFKDCKKYSTLISCRSLNWKLIYNDETKENELYNLKNDPKELKNLNKALTDELSFIKNKLFQEIQPFIKEYDAEKEIIKNILSKDFYKLL